MFPGQLTECMPLLLEIVYESVSHPHSGPLLCRAHIERCCAVSDGSWEAVLACRKLGAKDPQTTMTQKRKSAAPQRIHSSHQVGQENGDPAER